MNILYFGDIVGEPGRIALERLLPDMKKKYSADIVLANVENSAHGFGITPQTMEEIYNAGVDFATSGNHAWKNTKGVELLRDEPETIAVPCNVIGMPGRKFLFTTVNGVRVLIINVLGQAFMHTEYGIESPYQSVNTILQEQSADVIIVDFHAEATGEKRAMSFYLDGRASLLVGTHTHVQTADEKIENKGLGYISDLGYCGATDSSLGMDARLVVKKVAYEEEIHLEPPQQYDTVHIQGIFARIDDATFRTTFIERIDQRFRIVV